MRGVGGRTGDGATVLASSCSAIGISGVWCGGECGCCCTIQRGWQSRQRERRRRRSRYADGGGLRERVVAIIESCILDGDGTTCTESPVVGDLTRDGTTVLASSCSAIGISGVWCGGECGCCCTIQRGWQSRQRERRRRRSRYADGGGLRERVVAIIESCILDGDGTTCTESPVVGDLTRDGTTVLASSCSAIGISGVWCGGECGCCCTIQRGWQSRQRERRRRRSRYADGGGLRERVVAIIESCILDGDGTTCTESPVVGDLTRDGTTVLASSCSAIGISGVWCGGECGCCCTIQRGWQSRQRERRRRRSRYADGGGLRERVVAIIESCILDGDGTTCTESPVVGDLTRDGTTVLASSCSAIGISGVWCGGECGCCCTIQRGWQSRQRERRRRRSRYADGGGLRERVVAIIESCILDGDGTTCTESPVVGDLTRDGTTVLASSCSAIGISGVWCGGECGC